MEKQKTDGILLSQSIKDLVYFLYQQLRCDGNSELTFNNEISSQFTTLTGAESMALNQIHRKKSQNIIKEAYNTKSEILPVKPKVIKLSRNSKRSLRTQENLNMQEIYPKFLGEMSKS